MTSFLREKRRRVFGAEGLAEFPKARAQSGHSNVWRELECDNANPPNRIRRSNARFFSPKRRAFFTQGLCPMSNGWSLPAKGIGMVLTVVLTGCSYSDALLNSAPTSPSTSGQPGSAQAESAVQSPSTGTQLAALPLDQTPSADAQLDRTTENTPESHAVAVRPAAPKRMLSNRKGDRPFVTIRFNQPNVEYEDTLYEALSHALERKPSATFTIETVAPAGSTPAEFAAYRQDARRHAEDVLHAISDMGMPADRLSLSATMNTTVTSEEVRIYVR